MQYQVGVTIYGYVIIEAPSRNDAGEMYAAMGSEQILQDMKVNSIDSEHVLEVGFKHGE
ncbi:MAG: hypothetical protein ISS54_00740 [Dehalococcoidia bacterium]|nr:hypothetical protein [Dehalococcoidia bacterium]